MYLHGSKNLCLILLLLMLFFMFACTRPLFVTHWSDKGRALIKKKSHGYPSHGILAVFVCMNKLCLSKAERTNRYAKKRFKGFKNKNRVIPPNKYPKYSPDSVVQVCNLRLADKPRIFSKLSFETASSKVIATSYAELDSLVKAMKQRPEMQLDIVGHTDSSGETKNNLQLSLMRARDLAGYLINNGIAGSRIACKGLGDTHPIADNHTELGRARNRRVEYEVRW